MLLSFFLFIIELINLEVQSASIETVDPLSFKINIEKLEAISLTLIFNQEIDNRSNAKIKLSKSDNEKTFDASTEQDSNNLKKVEFLIEQKEFVGYYGKYELTYINDETIVFDQTIFIYNNDIVLKNPINRYELTKDERNIRTVKYEFQYSIVEDEIYRIYYYDNSNPILRQILSKDSYRLEDGKKLIIDFPGTSKVITYAFDIYPEYDKSVSIPEIQRFYLHFHDYLLKNEAIYIDKQKGSNLVSFITLFKQSYTSKPFTIYDSGQNIDCSSFSCKQNDTYYLCDCSLNFTRRNSPGKITIAYETNQRRELFIILYTNFMKLCYEKSEIEDLRISMEWIEEMEYDHFLYFTDSKPKILTQSFSGKSNSIITYSYKTSTLSLSSGIFNLESSIPSLNFSDYNLVDKNNLFIYIYPNTQLEHQITSFIFSHNESSQIVNLTFKDYSGGNILTEIVLKKDDNPNIIISGVKCENEGNSFICDLKDIIYNYEDDKNGNYSIYYNSACDNELKIEGRIVILKRGISLLSIYPTWVNKTTVVGTNITLTYDYEINQNVGICLYNNEHPITFESCLRLESPYSYNPVSKLNKDIIITLKDIEAGFYQVYTYVYKNTPLDSDIINILNESLGFKVSDDNIIFEFSHHYFVLNNNGDINKLIINVTDNLGQFGCGIIEDSEKQNLTRINCSYFEYQIKKIGTIKFNYYDIDGYIIPINDYITVVQYYSQLYSYISLKECYYYSFDISIDIVDSYENKFKLFLYLRSSDNSAYFLLSRANNENKYSLLMKNDLLINKNFYLYVSENNYDYEVFLHKSENSITFTTITVPLFIIDPNTTIVFSDIKCDLSKSKFIMKKDEKNLVQKNLNNCKYNINDKTISCNISGTFYNNDRYYNNYYYVIDEKNITFFNNNSNENTFVSKKLNEATFNIEENINGNDYSIVNPNKDFYFPLIDNLTNYKTENGINNTIFYIRTSNNFIIDDDNYKIEFNESLELNQILYINHLTRKKESWETGIENKTLFHFFNYKVNIKLSVIPTIFAYNNISKYEYPINFEFTNENDKLIYNSYRNLKNCTEPENINYDQCIDWEKGNFILNEANNYEISIGDGEKNAKIQITFIYYNLDKESMKCKTKTEHMDNIILNVYFPDNSLINKFHIIPEISIIDKSISGNSIIYTLNGSEIIIPETFIDMYIDGETFDHSFTLQEIGLNVTPRYNFSLINNEKIIYLIPDNSNDQKVSIFLRAENNENSKIGDINGFIIKNGNSRIELYFEKINDNSANIIFKNIASSSNYVLYYIDRCGNEIETDIKIEFYSFSFRRNYFILNNNANNNGQYLIIEGSDSNSTNIIIQKDGLYHGTMNYNSTSKYYYTILDKDSQGNYTFYISNNGIESPLNGIVYVRKNLEDLFTIIQVLPECLFLDEEKKELSQISYTISSRDETIKDISIFKSQFTINNSSFTNLSTNINSKLETFTLDYEINNIKSNIYINVNLYIYLNEKEDKDQPIYVFKYKYTNIKLNSEFAQFIYTDNDYISFNMSCKINNIETFYLNNSNNKNYKINCEERTNNYDEESKIYKCFLSSNDKDRNELLKFGEETFEYGYYDIKYKNNKITDQKLFLSHEIYTTNFTIEKQEDIFPGENTTVTIRMKEQIFYSPNVESVKSVKFGLSYLPTLFDSNFNFIFEETENYITASINIVKGYYYGIKQICRKQCSYCRNPDCQDLNVVYDIASNTPDVGFKFNKHYIALSNSTDKRPNMNINSLRIEITGEDINQVDIITYKREHQGREYNEKNVSRDGNNYYINDLEVGKYTFKYHVINGKYVSIKNDDVVLVVNYDYELFNYTELTKNCLYYKVDKGILVSITKNSSYEYKDDIIESYMEIYLNDLEFPYDKENGFKIINENIRDFNYRGNKFTLTLRENGADKEFIYSTLSDNTYITSFDLKENKEGYYYKDNIVFNNQYCFLNNIYILSDSDKNEPYSLLQCEYDESKRESYCDAIYYTFERKQRDNFWIYIGNPRQDEKSSIYFNTEKMPLIFNSIKDSNFELNYNGSHISISSSNFDMSHINKIKINNDSILYQSFSSINNNLITYKFQKNDSYESYLNELIRRDHSLDLSNTIKNKIVNKKIVEINCPDYTIYQNGFCLSCTQIALSNGGINKWYQNGQCVEECNNDEDFAIYDTEGFICKFCIEKTKIGDFLHCGCYEGTVKSDDNGICYLPDDERIKKLLIIRPNLQCRQRDGSTHNYCHPNNTDNCELKSHSGYSFPYCICKSGYSGKYCEFEDNSAPNLNGSMDVILNGTNDIIDENNPNIIAKIRGIIFFLEKDNNTFNYINLIDENKTESYINSTIKTINNDVNSNSTTHQIYDVIELAVYFLNYNIRRKRLRNLEENEDRSKLNIILENAHYLNYLTAKNTSNYNIQSDGLNLISFISYQKQSTTDDSFLTYIKNTTYISNTTGYINLLNNEAVLNNNTLIITFFNGLLFENKFEGVKVRFSTNNENAYPNDLNNFNLYLYSSNINVNFQLANYYLSKNIGIYNKYDKCFTEPCYFNKKLEFDLTQKYRKMHVFQRWSADSKYCRFNSFEEKSNTVELFCEKFEIENITNETLRYGELSISIKNDYIDKQNKVYNLPMRCPRKIDTLDGNYGFWIFLMICILEVIYIIGINILTFGSLRRVSIRKGLFNDELLDKIPIMSSSEENEKNSYDEALKKKIIYKSNNKIYQNSVEVNDNYGYFNKDFLECLRLNFRELHPLLSIFRVSIISPLIVNSWFVVFNILGLFGFNALIYYEGLIEKRIYDKKRNKFDYPMRKEFHKIILSILCQIALTVLIKFVVIVSLKQRDNLEAGLKKCKRFSKNEIDNDVLIRIDLFEEDMLLRRLIGGFLMLIISVFFFYYSVVFCGIYIKTQRNWVFGGVWSLFWAWIVFAPIYIIVISYIEYKKEDSYNPLVYNLKRLFCF